MTRVRTDPRGYVIGAACPCGGPLLAMPGARLYVCERTRCSRAPLSAAGMWRLLNAGRPALRVVPGRQRQAVG